MKHGLLYGLSIFMLVLSACSSGISVPLPSQPGSQPTTAAVIPLDTATPGPVQPTPMSSPGASPTLTPVPMITQTLAPIPTAVIPPPQNVILIIVDSLRPDHLQDYGYERSTDPNLQAMVGEKGARFTRVVSTSPWTCPSVAAMFTGRSPSHVGVTFTSMSNSIPNREMTLAEYLHAAGYYTAGFATTYCVKGRLGFSQGFDLYDDSLSDRTTADKPLAEEVNRLAMDWLENQWLASKREGQPLFLMLYYFDPHSWYAPPAPFDMLYDDDYRGPVSPDVFQNSEPVSRGELALTARDVQHLQALYDGEVRYWDENLGKMLSFLEEKGLMENTLLVVTSDHGEQFGEHGKWVHTNSLYEEVLRVPLYMRYDGIIPPGSVLDSPVQNFDLMPTVLQWTGIAVPENLDATGLQAIANGESFGDPARPLYSELSALLDPKHALYWVAPKVSLRSIEQGGWKLIHVIGHLEQDALYMLQPNSYYEIQNLVESEPGRYQEMLERLSNWFGLR